MQKEYPNLLILAGAGQNTGKTITACNLISRLSKDHEVVGLKITPHKHEQGPNEEIIIKTEAYTIVNETQTETGKDSAKMLAAGAHKVFYLQAEDAFLQEAFEFLLPELNGRPVICESGGLRDILTPGLFMFAKRETEIPEDKKVLLKYKPIEFNILEPTDQQKLDNIRFENGAFKI